MSMYSICSLLLVQMGHNSVVNECKKTKKIEKQTQPLLFFLAEQGFHIPVGGCVVFNCTKPCVAVI
jgi:hypothetical protein